VVIVSGHGGSVRGLDRPRFAEKDLVLDIAQKLGKLIEDRLGSRK
jgi:N-acetylmuramoyl-L-alanine amidase